MPLYYALVPNHITPDPNDRTAIPLVAQTYTIEDVIQRMTSRGSTVTKAEALSVWEELMGAITGIVKEGNSVNTGLFNVGPSIVGVFNGDDDGFDASRHQVKLRMVPGKEFRKAEAEIKVEKTTIDKRIPIILHFYDMKTDTVDEVVSFEGGVRMTGELLKFDEKDPLQGVFFVNVASGVATRVAGKFMRNKPGELIFMAPPLAAGAYKVEVRTLLSGTKDIRVGAFANELTVS